MKTPPGGLALWSFFPGPISRLYRRVLIGGKAPLRNDEDIRGALLLRVKQREPALDQEGSNGLLRLRIVQTGVRLEPEVRLLGCTLEEP